MSIGKTSLPILLCLALALAGGIWIAAAQQSSPATMTNLRDMPSWERINRAATKVKGNDPATVASLTDEVLIHHGVDQAPTAIQSVIKDRLVAAEIDYQNGKSNGLPEENVATTVNDLARRLNAPAYAYTDVNEVRQVRLRMLTLYPSLVGRGPGATRDDSKPHFEKRMSPIEAFHTAATLITQKILSPEFQSSAQEKEATSEALKSGKASVSNLASASDQRTHEMLSFVHQSAATVSPETLKDQTNHSLDLLGIGR